MPYAVAHPAGLGALDPAAGALVGSIIGTVVNTGANVATSIYTANKQYQATKAVARAQLQSQQIVSGAEVQLAEKTRATLVSLAPFGVGALIIVTLGYVLRGK